MDGIVIQKTGAGFSPATVAPKTKKPDSEQLIGLSGLTCKHALAVFITRPQADHQIGALRKNNEVGSGSQTGNGSMPALQATADCYAGFTPGTWPCTKHEHGRAEERNINIAKYQQTVIACLEFSQAIRE